MDDLQNLKKRVEVETLKEEICYIIHTLEMLN